MPDYQAVSSGHEISKKIADLLEDIDHIQYNGNNRARRVRNVNDYIQGRNDMPLEPLLDWAAKADSGAYAGRVAAVRQMLQAFQRQKSLLGRPYQMPHSLKSTYKCCLPERSDRAKVIDQETFDRAAQSGFPYGFFRHSFFDGVDLYCIPDGEDCSCSTFQNCSFVASRVHGAMFLHSCLYGCEFHSCDIQDTTFLGTTFANTHFKDCTLRKDSFLAAHLKSCLTVDCIMEEIDFSHAALDGCTYGRIQAGDIRNLASAKITQGGATAEECAENRAAVFRAFGVRDQERPPAARKRPSAPER